MNHTLKTVSLFIVFFVAHQLQAGQVTIISSRDSTILRSQQNNSNSKGVGMFAGLDPGMNTAKRALMAFDIAGNIPSGKIITSVTLGLTFGQAAGSGGTLGNGDQVVRTLDLHRLTTTWAEGTSGNTNTTIGGSGQGFPATPGDPTWLASSFHATTPTLWATPGGGGDFVSTPSATTIAGNPNFNQVFTWSSPTMVADVQLWLDDDSTNDGWLLKLRDETQTQSFRAFYTRDYSTNADFHPFLTVNFVPEPSSLLLLVLGVSGIINRRGLKL